jgi:hypothetical protein
VREDLRKYSRLHVYIREPKPEARWRRRRRRRRKKKKNSIRLQALRHKTLLQSSIFPFVVVAYICFFPHVPPAFFHILLIASPLPRQKTSDLIGAPISKHFDNGLFPQNFTSFLCAAINIITKALLATTEMTPLQNKKKTISCSQKKNLQCFLLKLKKKSLEHQTHRQTLRRRNRRRSPVKC